MLHVGAWTFLLVTAFCQAGTDPAGREWLENNAMENDDVTTTASGLQYRVIKSGAADAKQPLKNSPCVCHYAGTLLDGTEFDSSYARGTPATFAPNQARALLH